MICEDLTGIKEDKERDSADIIVIHGRSVAGDGGDVVSYLFLGVELLVEELPQDGEH